MMKISATTLMQLLPTHKHKNISDEFCICCSLYVASAIEISRSWQKQDCLKLSHRIIVGVHSAIYSRGVYNPVHPAGIAWVGYVVAILLKIVPPKQFTSYLLPFLMSLQRGWLAHGSYSNSVVRIQTSRQPAQANFIFYYLCRELYTPLLCVMYS